MSGDIAAAGDIITGALVARAVDPHGGDAQSQGHTLCLNCGTRLIGQHCHACGQSGHVHRTVGAIGQEIAHGVFHFEGKVWRTLPLLVFRPGALTRRYVAGERVRFVSPLALFLFTVFLMFATISWIGGEMPETIEGGVNPAAREQLQAELDSTRARLRRREEQRSDATAAGRSTAEIDNDLATLRTTERALGITAAAAAAKQDETIRTGWTRLDHGIAKARRNPGLALYKLQTSAYKYSWLLIPLSTPFVALLFLSRRRYGLYDHAIFVTYSLSFMMLLAIVLMIAGATSVAAGLIPFAALLIPPAHMFAQLRGGYSLRRRAAVWRTLALMIFAFVALSGFVTLLLLHGLTE